jgi:hypothetical protein
MSKAVKVDEDAKDRLEELQAEIRLRAGVNVTQQELLSRLISNAYEDKDDVIASFETARAPLSEEDADAFLGWTFSSGVETDEEDIDEILYG